jgi:hypothetical protein
MSLPIVYSTRFILGQATTTTSQSATVPAGKVWVLRTVTLVPAASGLTGAQIKVANAGYCWATGAVALGNSAIADLHHVVNAGEAIDCEVFGAAGYYMVSGYQLTLP